MSVITKLLTKNDRYHDIARRMLSVYSSLGTLLLLIR